jgi:hypothetical protein
MRVSIEFEVIGSTIDELRHKANESWQEFMNVEDEPLPFDAEFIIRPYEVDHYKATVAVRMKIEDDSE